MIPRYSRPEMSRIWDDEHKFQKWLDVELAVCDALADRGQIPKQAAANIRAKARFEVKRVREIEATVQHDVIAFITNLAEHVGPDARYIHLGLTSNDVVDTATALLMIEASELLMKDLEGLANAVEKRAFEHKNTVMAGRTHGVHAEPMTFGLKMAVWHSEVRRNIDRLSVARRHVGVGKLSGAVGTFAHLDPDVEAAALGSLGLSAVPIATQVVQRDRHAEFLAALAIAATSIERFAIEVRHLQRTEVGEVEEPFGAGQKGSSAMPHKRNPILTERLCGLDGVRRHAADSESRDPDRGRDRVDECRRDGRAGADREEDHDRHQVGEGRDDLHRVEHRGDRTLEAVGAAGDDAERDSDREREADRREGQCERPHARLPEAHRREAEERREHAEGRAPSAEAQHDERA